MTVDIEHRLPQGFFLGILIFLVTFLALVLAELLARPYAIAGIYMHGIPSESMMQTVSLLDLNNNGMETIWNLHIQPPLFDLLRMSLVKFSGTNNSLGMQHFVDQGIYLVWAFIYGLFCTLIFFWISKLTNVWYAIIATIIFALSPATLLYATLLETTFLSSFLIFWLVYLLWKVKNNENVSPWLLAVSFLLLFFTRSIFQWQWLILLAVCLLILKYPKDSIKKFLLIASLVVLAYMAKQYILFGISTTSSLTGVNLCQSIQACRPHLVADIAINQSPNMPEVLVRGQKLTGARNFNSLVDLGLNKAYVEDYRDRILAMSADQLFSNYYQNALIYFQPSSNYASTNLFLVSLSPRWKNYYEKFFSGPILPVLLVGLGLIWVAKSSASDILKSAGLFIPVLAIMAISIFFESGENMRFKYFVEPILFVFISVQFYHIGSWLKKRYFIH